MEVSSTEETVEPRLLESPVSDSATIGSEAPALIVTGTAIGIAGAAAATAAVASKAAAKSPAAKKPVVAAKKTTAAPAKPAASPLAAKPAVKDSVKKLEPATRYA